MTSAAGCAGPRMCRRLGCSSQAQAFRACRCSISLRAPQAAVRGVIGPGSLRQTTVSLVRGTQVIRRLREIAEPDLGDVNFGRIFNRIHHVCFQELPFLKSIGGWSVAND